MCGLLCGAEATPLQMWLDLLQEDEPLIVEELPDTAKKSLCDLLVATEAVLRDEKLDMQLLLPEDDLELLLQARGLGEWCNGFVTGLGLSGCYINQESNQETTEVLQDLIDIGKITLCDSEGEEEQQTFTEVVEYVQVAVLVLYRSLQFTGEDTHLLTNTVH